MLTLSVQYYVNLRSSAATLNFIVEQQQAINGGVPGVNSLSSGLYLDQMRRTGKATIAREQSERVKNVLIVDDQGNIKDSLDKNLIPTAEPRQIHSLVKGQRHFLAALESAVELPRKHEPLPEGMTIGRHRQRAFYFPVETPTVVVM